MIKVIYFGKYRLILAFNFSGWYGISLWDTSRIDPAESDEIGYSFVKLWSWSWDRKP